MLACNITAHPCMLMYKPSKHETLTQCCFNVGPSSSTSPRNKTTLGQCTHTPHWTIPHALLARDRRGLDDILGLKVLKFRPLHKIYLLGFYTGINVGQSIFRRLISINAHCIYYRRTHIKKVEDDMHFLQVNRGPWL